METQAKLLHPKLQTECEQGFTLIDLLVLIINLGILSAIALPVFLSQANNAKQSEARQYVGAMNRSQQAYYLEKQAFASREHFGDLGLGISTQTANYTYTIRGGGGTASTVTNAALPSKGTASPLKAYIGGVSAVTNATPLATLCEATRPPIHAGDAGFVNPIFIANEAPICPAVLYRQVASP